jgi:hypothetical protein
MEDLHQVMEDYPPLNDGYEVEVRKIVGFEDGSVYLGEWAKNSSSIKSNIKHGRGIQIWEDGTKYLGYHKNNKANVKGKLFHPDGDIYDGEWLDGKAENKGVYISNFDNSYYSGMWKQDKQHGHGEEYWQDGSKYEGEYYYGKKTGMGKFFWPDKSSYIGEFEDNMIEGKGK